MVARVEAAVRRSAIVTGGRRGIGRGIAQALAKAGLDVLIVDVEDDADVSETLASVKAAGVEALYLRADVADLERHANVVEAARRLPGALSVLVNNAGVTSHQRGDLLDVTPESFDLCIAVNVRAAFFLTQAFAQALMSDADAGSRFRCVVNISSANSEIVGASRADYCISKSAIPMMTQLFAARLAPTGVRVYDVRPGMIATPMTEPAKPRYQEFLARGGVPLARWGLPEDVGKAVAMLAAGGLDYSTGDTIRVDGGLHMYRIDG
jgi:3-oxoacyl-[acyl-carrier protein] reductase